MKIEDAIKYVLDGRGLLFTGAGFSFGAKNLLNSPIPSGGQFAEELITAIGMRGPADLDRASSAFLRKKSPDDLVKLLKEKFTVSSITESHRIIANLDWSRVYTTNYDTVYEMARLDNRKSTRTVTSKERPDGLVTHRDLVVHVNGSIETLNKDELSNSFKLTTASYAAESFEESGWAFHFRNDVRNSAVVVFIGYSLYDLDIARVLRAENIINKAIFIVAPPTEDNELEAIELQDFGEVFRIGVDDFARSVQQISKSYVPINAPILLNVWEKIVPVNSTKMPSDNDVIEFLTEGILNDPLFAQINSSTSNDYVTSRLAVQQVKESILENKKNVILHGLLGCGKTFIAESFGLLAHGVGQNVYILRSEDREEIGEVQEIVKSGDKCILIIESYHRHMRLIRWLTEANLDNVLLLLTNRTDVHEVFSQEISKLLSNQYVEIDCTKLENIEVESLSLLLDKYGLWGQQLSWTPDRKINYIKQNCARELPSLLVDILKSSHITEKYREIISSATNSEEIKRILICLFVLEVMNYYPTNSKIQELLGSKSIRWSYIKSNCSLKPIVDFNTNSIRTRSAVLGLHLLHTLFTPKFLVEAMIQMAKEAEDRYHEHEYRDILKDLTRFKFVALILPEKQRLQTTIQFYEGVKNLHHVKRNPQFWLQYGIAALTLEQMDRAERYFNDAYSLANTIPGYDCFQIDNYYARFLFEKAMFEETKEGAMQLVTKARTTLFSQMSKEERYYPFRAALGIFKVYDKWKSEWTLDQNKVFKGVFTELDKRCSAAGSTIRNHRYVVECAEKSKEKLASMGILQTIK